MVSDERKRNIASYSLMVVGLFWALFGTSATISQGSSGSDSSLRFILQVLAAPPGAVVTRVDFIWNLIGVFLILLGMLSYKYTREKTMRRYQTFRRVAVAGTSILLFFGLLVLNTALFFRYEYCYTTGFPGIPGMDCRDVFSFPNIILGIVTTLVGTVSFTVATLSNVT
jgi:hypothetical protein